MRNQFIRSTILVAAGLAFAQPAPVPVPMPAPDIRTYVDVVQAIDIDGLKAAAKVASDIAEISVLRDKFVYDDMLKAAALAQDMVPIKMGLEFDRLDMARLKMQTDVIRKDGKDMIKPKWGRSCGDGSIDSAEEANAVSGIRPIKHASLLHGAAEFSTAHDFKHIAHAAAELVFDVSATGSQRADDSHRSQK